MFKEIIYKIVRQAIRDELLSSKIEIKAELDEMVFLRRNHISQEESSSVLGKEN
jgi:hypothetical protein